jgi:3-hydroxybutyryl-CoA dehydrogenase
MGGGIAQVAATAGHAVTLVDVDEKALARGMDAIRWSVEKLARKGLITDDPQTVMNRLTPSDSLDGASGADLVIEAVYEDVSVKRELFARLDGIAKPGAILASNTSTIPITTLADSTQRPGQVIGLHFFGPVPLMRLVEIVMAKGTTEEVLEASLAFVKGLPKNPVVVRKDIPGFLMNRVFGAMVVEAMRLVEDGAGTAADIDRGMCDGFNMRQGPIAIADAAGLDITLNAFTIMHEYEPDRFQKCPALLEKLVAQGKLGRKTGEGFYKWDSEGRIIGPAL